MIHLNLSIDSNTFFISTITGLFSSDNFFFSLRLSTSECRHSLVFTMLLCIVRAGTIYFLPPFLQSSQASFCSSRAQMNNLNYSLIWSCFVKVAYQVLLLCHSEYVVFNPQFALIIFTVYSIVLCLKLNRLINSHL